MIVINIENLNNFLRMIDRRITNEIYYYFDPKIINNEQRVVLHFLAKLDSTFVLYQTIIQFPPLNEKMIKQKLKELDLKDAELIEGKISEIFISIS